MRARNIKPGFFRNEQLMQVAPLGRLLFAGLWCLADREGRLYDRPRQIKWDILPSDDCDVEALLTDLARRGFIRRYAVDGIGYIEVVNFLRHQRPHYKETASTLPPPTISPTQIPAQHRLIPDTRYSDTVFSDSRLSIVDCSDAERSITDYLDVGCPGAGRTAVGYSPTQCTDDAPSPNRTISDGNTNHAKRPILTDLNHTAKPAKTSPVLPHATDIPASVDRLLALWHTLSPHHTTADRHYIESALRQGYPEATLSALFHAKHAEYHTARSKKNLTLANLLGKKLPHHLANLPMHTAPAIPTTPTPTHTAPAPPSKPAPTMPTTPAPTHTAPTPPSKAANHPHRWTEAFFAE